jgi:2-amino-4-hydroxy-6-hydroxymethyldihydropteridine diphosphokinase
MAVQRTYIAVGSNIEPFERIPRCLQELTRIRDSRLIAESSRYLTRPWGVEGQANFVNLVVALDTALSPVELLRETQAIEARLERVKTIRNGPRTIDLDILLYGEEVVDEEHLRIPHPGLQERDFMLVPLMEIAPGAIHPRRNLPVSRLTSCIRYSQIIKRIDST